MRFALVAFLLLQAQQDENIWLLGPDNCSETDLGKAATALGKRCEAVGLKDMTVTVAEKDTRKAIRVTAKQKLTKTIRDIVGKLGNLAGNQVELRFTYKLTADEKKKYKPPTASTPGEAPPGAVWTRLVGEDGPSGNSNPVLLRGDPVIGKAGLSKLVINPNVAAGDKDCYYEIGEGDTARLAANKTIKTELAVFMIDGMTFEGQGRIDYGATQFGTGYKKARYQIAFRPQIFDASITNPLPFVLKPGE